jgi:putative sigma-54 modulation protein
LEVGGGDAFGCGLREWRGVNYVVIIYHFKNLEAHMRVTFTARHFKPSDRLKSVAVEEVKRLKKYYDDILDCEIILDYVKQQQIAEVIIKVYGTKLAIVEKSEDMYKSINLAVDKLERKLKRYKGKLREFDNKKVSNVLSETS